MAKWGTKRTFAGYGLLCGVALAAFAFVNFRGGEEPPAGGVADEEARAVAEAGVLAPHGVPSNPLPRALSSTRLADLAHHDNYGATQVLYIYLPKYFTCDDIKSYNIFNAPIILFIHKFMTL